LFLAGTLAWTGGEIALAQAEWPTSRGALPPSAGPYRPQDWLSDDPWLHQRDHSEKPAAPIGWKDRILAVTQGRVQIEGGYVFVHDASGGWRVSEHAVPDLLLRVGLTRRLELRIGWPGWVATRYEGPSGGGSSSDTLDPNVGFMLDLCSQQGWVPQTAVAAAFPITREGNPFAMEGLQPLSQLLYCWYPTDRLTVGGATGVALFRERGDDFTQWQQSVHVDLWLTDRISPFDESFPLNEGTDPVGPFVEWEALVDHGSPDDGSQHMLGGGFSWCCTDRFQVGWRASGGLNARAPNLLTDVRVAWRF
jgi:hypothetical protein